jgi:hypothetical protein
VAYPTLCPKCLSKYPDIRGMLYPLGSYIGDQCEDDWHKGASYDPNVFILSDADRDLLTKAKVKF